MESVLSGTSGDGRVTDMEVHTPAVERRAIDLLATLRSYAETERSSTTRRIAAYTVGSDAEKDLLRAVDTTLRELADDSDSRVTWADHPSDDRYDGAETDRPKRLQLRRGC